MAGLNLRGGATVNLGGVTPAPTTGNGSVTMAAFSPGATPTATGPSALSPTKPFGASLWIGVGAIVLLCLVRHSLPR